MVDFDLGSVPRYSVHAVIFGCHFVLEVYALMDG